MQRKGVSEITIGECRHCGSKDTTEISREKAVHGLRYSPEFENDRSMHFCKCNICGEVSTFKIGNNGEPIKGMRLYE